MRRLIDILVQPAHLMAVLLSGTIGELRLLVFVANQYSTRQSTNNAPPSCWSSEYHVNPDRASTRTHTAPRVGGSLNHYWEHIVTPGRWRYWESAQMGDGPTHFQYYTIAARNGSKNCVLKWNTLQRAHSTAVWSNCVVFSPILRVFSRSR